MYSHPHAQGPASAPGPKLPRGRIGGPAPGRVHLCACDSPGLGLGLRAGARLRSQKPVPQRIQRKCGVLQRANHRAQRGQVRAGSAGQGFTLPVPTCGQTSRAACGGWGSPVPRSAAPRHRPTSVRRACPGLTASTLLPGRGWAPALQEARSPSPSLTLGVSGRKIRRLDYVGRFLSNVLTVPHRETHFTVDAAQWQVPPPRPQDTRA